MEQTLTIHTAGQAFFWEITLKDAMQNQMLLNGMAERDQQLIKWLYEHD